MFEINCIIKILKYSKIYIIKETNIDSTTYRNSSYVRPEKFQFMEKWQNRNFNYEIVITVKNP